MADKDKNILIAVCAETCIKIIKWKVREGFQVRSGQLILLYELIDSDDKEIKQLKSKTKSGVVKRRLFKEGDNIKKGVPILELSECSHTTVIKDMCADCGADLRQNENGISEASVPMIHSVPELKVTQKLALKLGQEDTERLLQDRKLVLLVDLDQTLIHTTNETVPNNLKDVYHFQLYGQNSPWYHTRLRPGTPQFLANMAPYFELHICTFGARDYAHTIATFLDEDGKYFSHRILSRDECFNATCKIDNLKALFPCGDSMVCIIDDREDVWNMTSNLIQVKPYHFFQHTGDINAPPGFSKNEVHGKGLDLKDLQTEKEKDKEETFQANEEDKTSESSDSLVPEEKNNLDESVIDSGIKGIEIVESSDIKDEVEEENKATEQNDEITKDETIPTEIKIDEKIVNTISEEDQLIEIEDPDDYLLYLEEILKLIHKRFYSIFETTKEIPDLKLLIPKIRSEVLVGKNLVFSGLVPNHMKLTQSKAYQIATCLGANVTQMLETKTTHLVAVTAGTLKVNAARKRPHVKIVRPDWLWSCAERWECVEEKIFPLNSNKLNKSRQPPPHCQSPEHTVNYNVKPEKGVVAVAEPKFIDTINPLLSFSNADIAKMNEEFEEFFESSSSDDEPVDIENPPVDKVLRKRKRQEEKEDVNVSFFSRPEAEKIVFVQEDENIQIDKNESSSSEDEMPSAKFRRGGDLPSDLDMGSDAASEGSENPIDEEDDSEWNMMGAALEREFLGLE